MPELAAALVVILAILAGALFLTLDPRRLARAIRYGFIGTVIVLGLFLALRGLAVLDIPLGAVALIALQGWSRRGFSGLDRLKAWASGTKAADRSEITTPWLRMTLDRSSGALDGEVLSGQFAGAPLAQLGLEQLRLLLAECAAADGQSARLIETYLDRTHPDWRDAHAGAEATAPGDGRMTEAEALAVLGLDAGATPDQVKDAHRRLMAKLHPDHGGTNYLAGKINAARDFLLKCPP